MDWNSGIKGFKSYLQLELGLSPNSVKAYMRDVGLFSRFATEAGKGPKLIELTDLENFLAELFETGLSPTSQARITSGLKSFFNYLLIENERATNPCELLEAPRPARKLPVVLSVKELEAMLNAIDLSQPQGQRDRAIMETLYSCGLRVSELTGLRISLLYLEEDFIAVRGKGDKQRLIPIGRPAARHIKLYLHTVRNHRQIKPGNEDILFLNRRGSGISRVSVFNLVKKLAAEAGIEKTVSPHTLRHTFATQLVDGGANLRAVQEMLGHESITTTEIYTHLDREYLRSEILSYHPRWGADREAQK